MTQNDLVVVNFGAQRNRKLADALTGSVVFPFIVPQAAMVPSDAGVGGQNHH
ncbi:MAG: hypothetical protein ACWA49_10785 [Ruegeria sp.]